MITDSTYLNTVIGGCINNDIKYQSILYKHFYKTVFNVAIKYYNNIQKAEDATQDIFLKVYNNLHKFTGIEPQQLNAWLSRLAKNFIIDTERKRKINYTSYNDVIDNIEDTNDLDIVQRCTDKKLFEAIDKLSDQYKIVINMFYFDNCTHEQISKKLGIEVGTSKSNLFRAKAKMKKYLEVCSKN